MLIMSETVRAEGNMLDQSNYLFWESVVLPLIEGNMLVSHIDDTGVVPARCNADGSPNPAYAEWVAIDRLLVNFLRGAMNPDVGAHLMHCHTTHDLWEGARELTCGAMKSRVFAVKSELHKMRKQGLKMDGYLLTSYS